MKKIILAALATLTLVACGGPNPRVYLVARAPIAEQDVPTSCTNDTKSPFTETYTNLAEGAEFELWDGVDGKQYLDIGAGALIEGDGKAFNGTYVNTYVDPEASGNTWTENSTITVSFTELGATARGSFATGITRTCAGTTDTWCELVNKEPYTCAQPASAIVGRQITVENQKNF